MYDEKTNNEAQKYNQNMIIAAPQLNDWGQTSADRTIDLTEYLLRRPRAGLIKK